MFEIRLVILTLKYVLTLLFPSKRGIHFSFMIKVDFDKSSLHSDFETEMPVIILKTLLVPPRIPTETSTFGGVAFPAVFLPRFSS